MINHRKKPLTAIVDTREQKPLSLEKHGFRVVRESLPFGDYTLKYPDLSKILIIERKSLPDFIACCTRERKRFEKEILALRGYKYKFVICEFNMDDIVLERYKSMISADSVVSSVCRWTAENIPFLCAGSPNVATYMVSSIMKLIARDIGEYARRVYQVENQEAAR